MSLRPDKKRGCVQFSFCSLVSAGGMCDSGIASCSVQASLPCPFVCGQDVCVACRQHVYTRSHKPLLACLLACGSQSASRVCKPGLHTVGRHASVTYQAPVFYACMNTCQDNLLKSSDQAPRVLPACSCEDLGCMHWSGCWLRAWTDTTAAERTLLPSLVTPGNAIIPGQGMKGQSHWNLNSSKSLHVNHTCMEILSDCRAQLPSVCLCC